MRARVLSIYVGLIPSGLRLGLTPNETLRVGLFKYMRCKMYTVLFEIMPEVTGPSSEANFCFGPFGPLG